MKSSKILKIILHKREKKRYDADRDARSLLIMGLTNDIYNKIDSYNEDAKSMWDQLERMMQGSKIGNQMKMAICINRYEEFKAKEDETLEQTYEKFQALLNELSKNKIKKSYIENNVKFLSILQPEWEKVARRMKQNQRLSEMPLHELYETIRQAEEEVEEKRNKKKPAADPIALVVDKSDKSFLSRSRKGVRGNKDGVSGDHSNDGEELE